MGVECEGQGLIVGNRRVTIQRSVLQVCEDIMYIWLDVMTVCK